MVVSNKGDVEHNDIVIAIFRYSLMPKQIITIEKVNMCYYIID